MHNGRYVERRGQLEQYFDRTAAVAWERLTSDAPVSRIRATVRAGRDRMRETLLRMLPQRMSGARVLDAGCGTGAMAQALEERGAQVVAIDLSPTLVELARQRAAVRGQSGIEFRTGDMSDPALGQFDYVVAMDSLIHYDTADIVRLIASLAERTRASLAFTFAPRTPALALMHTIGRVFPRSNRAPAISPVAEMQLRSQLAREPALRNWRVARAQRIASGFYTSHAMQLVHV